MYRKGNVTKNIRFPLERKKPRLPRHLPQLSIWRVGLDNLEIDAQLNSLKAKWKLIQRLLNPTNALLKYLTLYRFNLILNSNQVLSLFGQKQILRSNRHENLLKQNNEDFFIHLQQI